MPAPFCVFIIESPSAKDILIGRTEGKMLSQLLKLAGIPCAYSMAIDAETFSKALGDCLPHAVAGVTVPTVVHISAHGNEQGIGLSDRSEITWEQLAPKFREINRALSDNLILSMSSCKGAWAAVMACEDPSPFACVIGHPQSPTWSDTAVGFAAFYHLLAKGRSLMEALEGMRSASGDNGFDISTVAQMKAAYAEVLRDLTIGQKPAANAPRGS